MAHRQGVALGVQISAALEFTWLLLGVDRLTQRVDRFVEICRCKVGGEGVYCSHRKSVGFAGGNKAAAGSAAIRGLASIFFEGNAAEGKAGTHVVTQHRPLLEILVSLLDLGVAGELFEELR